MRSVLTLCAVGSTFVLAMFAVGCGPGDGCDVTLTCDPPNADGGAGGTGAGSGTSSANGGSGAAGPSENGETCTEADGCASGFCVDGVCCADACDATCMACNVTGSEGTCTAAEEGSPDDACGLATCDGAGMCLFAEHIWSDAFDIPNLGSDTRVAMGADNSLVFHGPVTSGVDFGGGSRDGSDFVVKFDANGLHEWSKGLLAQSGVIGFQRVAVADNGDVLIGGYISGVTDFGGPTSLDPGGANRSFVVRYSSSGGFLAQALLPEQHDIEIYADQTGVIVIGEFSDTVAFDGGAVTATDEIDAFVLRLDASLDHDFSEGFGGDGNDRNITGAVADNGDVLMAYNTNSAHGVVHLVDGNGNEIWAKDLVDFQVRGLAFDSAGDVVVVGTASETEINLGGGALNAVGRAQYAFVVYERAGGAHKSSVLIGSEASDRIGHVAIDAAGDIVIGGVVTDNFTADFGGGILTGDAAQDGFLSKLGLDGTLRWSAHYTGTGKQSVDAVAVSPDGRVGVAGVFQGEIAFGDLTSTAFAARFMGVLGP